jgi:hypothetical protein
VSTSFNPLTLLGRARLFFRQIRRTRPFWAAIWTMLGGFIIFEIPYTSIGRIVKTGLPGVGGAAIGILIMAMGVFLLVSPSQRYVVSVITAVLALASFPISNLGGFVVGMALSILGASMGFAWMPEKPVRKYKWFRRVPGANPDESADGAAALNTAETASDTGGSALMAQPAL